MVRLLDNRNDVLVLRPHAALVDRPAGAGGNDTAEGNGRPAAHRSRNQRDAVMTTAFRAWGNDIPATAATAIDGDTTVDGDNNNDADGATLRTSVVARAHHDRQGSRAIGFGDDNVSSDPDDALISPRRSRSGSASGFRGGN